MNKFKKWLIHRLGGVSIEDMAGLSRAFESQMTKGRIVTLTAKMNITRTTDSETEFMNARRELSYELIEEIRPFITYDTTEDGALTASIDVLRKGDK